MENDRKKNPNVDEKFPIELTQLINIYNINLSKNAQFMCELSFLLYLVMFSEKSYETTTNDVNIVKLRKFSASFFAHFPQIIGFSREKIPNCSILNFPKMTRKRPDAFYGTVSLVSMYIQIYHYQQTSFVYQDSHQALF